MNRRERRAQASIARKETDPLDGLLSFDEPGAWKHEEGIDPVKVEKVNIFQSFSGKELRQQGIYAGSVPPSDDLRAHIRKMPDGLNALIIDDSGIVVDNLLYSALPGKFKTVYYPNPYEECTPTQAENIHYEVVKLTDHPGEIEGKLDIIVHQDVNAGTDFFYDALNEGGIIAGRNYHREPVIAAVKEFRRKNRITAPLYVTMGDMWYWFKPKPLVEHVHTPSRKVEPVKGQTHLRNEYIEKYGSNAVFVETGTYLGETIEQIQKQGYPFKCIWSVDIDQGMVDRAREKFKDDPRVMIECADSIDWLEVIVEELGNDRATFWLDAHASGPLKGGRSGGSPVLDELRIIKKSHRKDHTIFIDDKRLFGSAEWSFVKLEDALALLKEINPDYKIEFLDGQVPGDVIVAYI